MEDTAFKILNKCCFSLGAMKQNGIFSILIVFLFFTSSSLGGVDHIFEIVLKCLKEATLKQTVTEKHIFLLPKVRECIVEVKIDKNGNHVPQFNFVVGQRTGDHIGGVCRYCFALCHGCSDYQIRKCTQEILNLDDASVDSTLNDRSNIPTDAAFLKNLKELVLSQNATYTSVTESVMKLPNTEKSRFCYTWIQWYTTSFGDHCPNSNEIHLTTVEKDELWKEYMGDVGEKECVSYTRFVYTFNTHFQNV